MKTRLTVRDLWRRGQHGWPADFPVVQLPNAPLLVALGAWLVAVLTDGSVHAYARATFYTGLAAWAWTELADGTNWFRRALGAGGLVLRRQQGRRGAWRVATKPCLGSSYRSTSS